jgi:hypothetical protein
MDPFSGMRGFDDDDDDEEEIVFIENGRVTVIKTGNSNRNHGKRGNKYGQRRRNNDPFMNVYFENKHCHISAHENENDDCVSG